MAVVMVPPPHADRLDAARRARMRSRRCSREEIARNVWPLVEDGPLRPAMDRTFPLAEAAAAHARMEAGEHIGKIVLEVKNDPRQNSTPTPRPISTRSGPAIPRASPGPTSAVFTENNVRLESATACGTRSAACATATISRSPTRQPDRLLVRDRRGARRIPAIMAPAARDRRRTESPRSRPSFAARSNSARSRASRPTSPRAR